MNTSNEQKGYKILTSTRIGKGAFGEIYKCIDLSTNQECAVKIVKIIFLWLLYQTSSLSNHNQLPFEAKVLRYLKGGIGIPYFYSFHSMDNKNYLFMELLGKSIETIFKENNCKLSINFLVNVIEQMVW